MAEPKRYYYLTDEQIAKYEAEHELIMSRLHLMISIAQIRKAYRLDEPDYGKRVLSRHWN